MVSKGSFVPAVAVTTLVVAAFAVAACGDDEESSGSTAASTEETKKLDSLLFVNPLPKQEQWRLIGDCMKEAAEKAGIEYTEAGPTGEIDAVKMTSQIQQGISSKVGAIVTYPASESFKPLLEQASKAGIVTGTMYGGADSALGDFNTGLDFDALGRSFAEPLAEREGEQRVGLLAVSPTGVGKAFTDGFKAAAAETDNVKVVGTAYTEDNPTKTLGQVNSLFNAHPDINVFVSHMGTSTQPVISAIKAKKLVGKVVLVGNGGSGGGIEGAEEGIVYRFLLQDLCKESNDVVDAASKLAAGETVPEQINVDTVMVDDTNWKEYDDKGWK